MPKDLKIGYLKQQLHNDSTNTIYKECENIFLPIIHMEEKLRSLEKEISDPNCKNFEDTMEKYGRLQEEFAEKDGYSYPSKIRGTLIGLGFFEKDFVEVKRRWKLCGWYKGIGGEGESFRAGKARLWSGGVCRCSMVAG